MKHSKLFIISTFSLLVFLGCSDEPKIKITDQGTGADETMKLMEARKQKILNDEEEARLQLIEEVGDLESIIQKTLDDRGIKMD